MAKDYPVGKAQQVILDALGIKAESHQEAERIFEEIGIVVVPVRQGRKSVPQVHRLETSGGGWNVGGDGESYEVSYKDADLSKVVEWMVS
jgi:cyanophycinase-like exopeptidase